MSDFDPERFEEEKYVAYFPKLQQAYKNAFNRMNEEYDSTLIHAIDQRVLAESEPFYEDGGFRIQLPEEPTPYERVKAAGVVTDEAKVEELLEVYSDRLVSELRRVFNIRE